LAVHFPFAFVNCASQTKRFLILGGCEVFPFLEDFQRAIQTPFEWQVLILVGVESTLLKNLKIDVRMFGLFQILTSQLEEAASKSDAFGRSQPLGQRQKLGRTGSIAAQDFSGALLVGFNAAFANVKCRLVFAGLGELFL